MTDKTEPISPLIIQDSDFLTALRDILAAGDKFNAMASAANALLQSGIIESCSELLLSFQEKSFIDGSLQYVYFRMQPGFNNGRLFVELGGETKLVEHGTYSELPFAQPEDGVTFAADGDKLNLYAVSYGQVLGFLQFSTVNIPSGPENTAFYFETLCDFLSISLKNIHNDFQLLVLKKQLEQKQQIIMENSAVIERQNIIFRSLMETMLGFHVSTLEQMLDYVLKKLHGLFPDFGFGLVIHGERSDLVEWAEFSGMETEEQDKILRLPHDSGDLPFADPENWHVLELKAKNSRVLGRLFIRAPKLEDASREIIIMFLEQVSATAENKVLLRELEKAANTDGLTGAFNRMYFERQLEHARKTVQKFQNLHFCLMVIDLNGLKRVNDEFGHVYGDAMIIKSAGLLIETCRKSDVVSRFGGDELAVLCPSTTLEQGEELLSRIREVEAGCFVKCEKAGGLVENVPVRLSIGLASTSEGISDDKLTEVADQRMYADKEAYYATHRRYR
jgi:diguanylate cyclase (GGDEF)-like protein